MVDKISNLMALLLKEIGVEGSIHVQLVEGTMDLAEFIAEISGVKRLTKRLVGGTLVVCSGNLKKSEVLKSEGRDMLIKGT